MTSSGEQHDATLVDPLRNAAPGRDIEARRAKAGVAEALFGETDVPGNDDDAVTIGRYVVRERLGAGGMGVVYRAHDPDLERAVALKVLLPDVADDPNARARMIREARALAQLSHPNVVPVYDVGTSGDEVFLAMELVEGQDLAKWLDGGDRPWREVVALFLQAGHGLAAAHERGLVHRDFKPANVLVGDDGRARVVDFGLARPVDPAAMPLIDRAPTRTGAIIGTPMFMSPEQLEGEPATASSDQFSFCVALYTALYGTRPFPGGTVASYVSHVIGGEILEPESSEVPRAVYKALRRGLASEPGRRWENLPALVDALTLAMDAVVPARSARGPSGGAAAALVAAAIAGGVALWWATGSRAEDSGPTAPSVAAMTGPDARHDGASQPDPTAGGILGSTGDTGSQQVAVEPGDGEESGDGKESGDGEESVDGEETGGPTGADGPDAVLTDAAPATGTPSRPERAAPDWCSFHEDNYSLVDRRARRRTKFIKRERCWVCRVERNKARISRLSPRDCGGFQMCHPGPVQECG